VRVAFDNRPRRSDHGIGRYASCLLRALRDIAGEHDEILETHRPRGAEVFHTPWLEGAMLHSPCPMVVTLHDLDALTRRSERLRCGGVHLRLRHLALQRATHVIVPTEGLANEAAAEFELDRERVIVIPPAPERAADASALPTRAPLANAARIPSLSTPAPPTWTWEDAGRETWRVYEDALARPARPCVGGFGRRRPARGARGPAPR
jgi:Glycosyltransferase Family 4